MQVPRMPSILHPMKLQSTPSAAMRERATSIIPSRQVRNTTTTPMREQLLTTNSC